MINTDRFSTTVHRFTGAFELRVRLDNGWSMLYDGQKLIALAEREYAQWAKENPDDPRLRPRPDDPRLDDTI